MASTASARPPIAPSLLMLSAVLVPVVIALVVRIGRRPDA